MKRVEEEEEEENSLGQLSAGMRPAYLHCGSAVQAGPRGRGRAFLWVAG